MAEWKKEKYYLKPKLPPLLSRESTIFIERLTKERERNDRNDKTSSTLSISVKGGQSPMP